MFSFYLLSQLNVIVLQPFTWLLCSREGRCFFGNSYALVIDRSLDIIDPSSEIAAFIPNIFDISEISRRRNQRTEE